MLDILHVYELCLFKSHILSDRLCLIGGLELISRFLQPGIYVF